MTDAIAYAFIWLFAKGEEATFLVYSLNFEAATGATEAAEKNWEDVEEEEKGE